MARKKNPMTEIQAVARQLVNSIITIEESCLQVRTDLAVLLNFVELAFMGAPYKTTKKKTKKPVRKSFGTTVESYRHI